MPDTPRRPPSAGAPDPATAAALRRDTAAYVAPFLLYVGLMGIENAAKLPAQIFYPIRCVLCAATVLFLSGRLLGPRPTRAVASIALGAAVFLVWIGPDVLFGYRHFWLFENSLFGAAASAAPPELRASTSFRLARTLGSTLVVPVVEELFWRGWLMRWLIHHQFTKVPLGTYARSAFWIVGLLFASEHGPYWEVGLAAGILYNWWMLRTHNLADCIVAHTVTNGLLSAYVLVAGRWEYWL